MSPTGGHETTVPGTDLLLIRLFGDPILREVAQPVTDFDEALRLLASRMHITIRTLGANGIAGNQVGVLRRVFVWRDGDDASGSCVNPVVVSTSDDTGSGEEGCLSFPRLFRFAVERSVEAKVRCQDLRGDEQRATVTGAVARTFLHEIDHLNGILFLDHLAAHDRARADRLIAAGALNNIPQPYEGATGTGGS